MKKNTSFIISIIMIMSALSLLGCENNSNGTDEPDMHYAIFYTFEDFATYVKTGSQNPDDYSKDNPPFAIPHKKLLKKESFLNIAELFSGQNDFLDDLLEIHVDPYASASYRIYFKSGIYISITYDNKVYSSKNVLDNKSIFSDPNKIKNISLLEAEKGVLKNDEYIAHKIDDYTIAYNLYYHNDKLYEYYFTTQIDGFRIYISLQSNGLYSKGTRYDNDYKKLLADPLNAPIAVFFTEGEERDDAFRNLVKAIENRQIISEKE